MFEPELTKEVAEIAAKNELEPETLMAVVEVESAGRLGAKVKGRVEPLIRFEGHYFYRLLSNKKRNLAVVQGLAHSRAGKVKNPMRQAFRWKMLRLLTVQLPSHHALGDVGRSWVPIGAGLAMAVSMRW